eukprot:14694944-Heterocapsa_arctica.AAC.1
MEVKPAHKIREVKLTLPLPIAVDVKAWMVKHGRVGQLKGTGGDLKTGSWVALGPPYTEHLVPIIAALPALFDPAARQTGEGVLAHRLRRMAG